MLAVYGKAQEAHLLPPLLILNKVVGATSTPPSQQVSMTPSLMKTDNDWCTHFFIFESHIMSLHILNR